MPKIRSIAHVSKYMNYLMWTMIPEGLVESLFSKRMYVIGITIHFWNLKIWRANKNNLQNLPH